MTEPEQRAILSAAIRALASAATDAARSASVKSEAWDF
jgi:hypothetical protein